MRAYVTLGRRQDANKIVRAIRRVSGLPMSMQRRDKLEQMVAYRGRVLGSKIGSRGGAVKPKPMQKRAAATRSGDEEEGSEGDGDRGSESEREWRVRGEHTERTQLTEQYMRKVQAVSAHVVLVCWIDEVSVGHIA